MSIALENIRIEGLNGIQKVLDFEMKQTYCEHGKAKLKAEMSQDFSRREMMNSFEGKRIRISAADEGKKIDLFHGFIENCEFDYQNQYSTITLCLISGSYLLDVNKKSRSFQDINMTYQDVVDEVLKDTAYAYAVYSCGEIPIQKPLIQFEETDWLFILRLASHFHTAVLPDVVRGQSLLRFGFADNGGGAAYDRSNYKLGIDESYYKAGGEFDEVYKKDFLYYEILWDRDCEIGDRVDLLGKQLVICSKEAMMLGNVLEFRYHLSGERFVMTRKGYNSNLAGAILNGTVIKTNREFVRLHLDIDGKQDVDTAYDYPWTPETGNLFYCMPKVGTKAGLYIGTHDEQASARALHSPRMNGGSIEELKNPQNRYFTSEHGKRLQCLPDSIGFLGGYISSGHKIEASDDTGIEIKSEKSISITAKEQLVLEGAQIHAFAPSQITAVKSNRKGNTVFNICNQFDAIGKASGLKGNDRKKYSVLTKEDYKRRVEKKYNSDACVMAAFSSIPSGLGDSSPVAVALRGAGMSGGYNQVR